MRLAAMLFLVVGIMVAAMGGGAGMLGEFVYDRYEKYRGKP